MKALMYMENHEVGSLLAFSVESFFDLEIKSHSLVKECLEQLEKEKPDILVIDCLGPESIALLEYCRKTKQPCLIHYSEGNKPDTQGMELKGAYTEPQLLKGISEVLKGMGAQMRDISVTSSDPVFPYFRVGVPFLLKLNPLIADIYIKLSELKYVKLFHKGSEFTEAEVEKYHRKKKIKFFYVQRKDADATAAALNGILEKLLQEEGLKKEVSTVASVETINVIHDLVSQVGFTPEVQKLVKNEVDLVLKEMASIPSLGGILESFELEKDKYVATHSHMLAEVICALSIAMEWQSETSFKKLSMAAILHDMCLTNQKLCKVKDLKELNERREEFTQSDVETYRGHTKRAATIMQGMKEAPADVDKIILQHHENPMGTGFPEQINHVHIHPMASLMMVGHDLVDWVLDHPGTSVDMDGFLTAYMDKYKMGNFKKILKALATLDV